jgi:hypothetical protein
MLTGKTLTRASVRSEVDVLSGHWVPSNTEILLSQQTTIYIHLVSHRLEVIRVAAVTDSAQMI